MLKYIDQTSGDRSLSNRSYIPRLSTLPEGFLLWMVKVIGRVKNCRSLSSPSMVEVSTLNASVVQYEFLFLYPLGVREVFNTHPHG